MSARRPIGPPLVLGLAAFLFTLAWQEQRTASVDLAGRRQQLAEIVALRQAHIGDLESRLIDLRAHADALAARSRLGRVQQLRRLAAAIGGQAGTAPLVGAGLVVTLADAADAPSADFRIQDVDVQAVVNALWGAGAEAIAVNDQRVVGTTAIRNAAEAVLVNYLVLTSPYRIVAIGDPEALRDRFAASETAERFHGWAEIYGLGFRFDPGADLAVPGFGGTLRFRYARTEG